MWLRRANVVIISHLSSHSPRDTITISKTFTDATTLISISTSLPRSIDEPAFLRPSPPYVRSHVHLLAWCIQLLPSPSSTITSPSSASTSTSTSHTPLFNPPQKVRITIFWQWNLKGSLFPTTYHSQITSLLVNYVEFVREKGDLIPLVGEYGEGIEVLQENFDSELEILSLEYNVVGGVEDIVERKRLEHEIEVEENQDGETIPKIRRTSETSLEVLLSVKQGWDINLYIKSLSEDSSIGYIATAEISIEGTGRITLRITHDKLEKLDQLVKVNLSIQRLAGGKGIRINGELIEINPFSIPKEISPYAKQILDDAASLAPSLTDSLNSSSFSLSSSPNSSTNTQSHNTATQEINALLRRNYIYFTSLLQEPEAKWRHVSDSHGVTVTALNSIDPTLTIYRAEATIVGVGVWDVFSTICTPGARMQWDKNLEEASLLNDISELSSLWHIKMKANWPVAWVDDPSLSLSRRDLNFFLY